MEYLNDVGGLLKVFFTPMCQVTVVAHMGRVQNTFPRKVLKSAFLVSDTERTSLCSVVWTLCLGNENPEVPASMAPAN